MNRERVEAGTANGEHQAGERTLRLSDVHHARPLIVCNAVHGAVPGRLVIDP